MYLSRKCVKGHYFDGSKNTTLLLLNSCVIYLLQTNVYLISNLLEFMAIGYQFFYLIRLHPFVGIIEFKFSGALEFRLIVRWIGYIR